MAAFLLVTWQGGGNVPPLVVLGRALAARGHGVRVLGPASLASRFENEGIAFTPHRDQDQWGRDALRGLADDVIEEVGRAPTDVAVVDFMQPHALSAVEALDVRVAAFVHTLYQRVAIGERSPMNMYGDVTKVNALRVKLGVPALDRMADLLDRADLVLVTTVRELDRPDDELPANVHYVGPLVEEAGPDAGWRPSLADSVGPLVHVSMGTVAPADRAAPILQRVMDALADQPVRVHIAVCTAEVATWDGAILDPDTLNVPSNAFVTGYVRHAAVLPHANVFVTHAGLSSIGAGLASGVPMVCVPITNEQPQNAQRVATSGAGIELSPEANVDELRSAINEAMSDERYRSAARRIGESIRAHGNGTRASELLEQLALS